MTLIKKRQNDVVRKRHGLGEKEKELHACVVWCVHHQLGQFLAVNSQCTHLQPPQAAQESPIGGNLGACRQRAVDAGDAKTREHGARTAELQTVRDTVA